MVSSLTPVYAASIKVTDVKGTTVKVILNASGVSGVQQFSYKNEGIAYGYIQSGSLNIFLPDGTTFANKTQYPLLGDITADKDGNICVFWGCENKSNNRSVETVFISKYSPDGKLVKTTGFAGVTMEGGGDGGSGNTKAISSSGSCVSAIHGDTLIVHYARAMYNGHQSSNTIGVNISDMSPTL